VSTVSHKQTERCGSRCDSCGLWFEFVHRSAGGRFLCRMCLELKGLNRRTAWDSSAAR
jgi:hypothetical protein